MEPFLQHSHQNINTEYVVMYCGSLHNYNIVTLFVLNTFSTSKYTVTVKNINDIYIIIVTV